MRYLFLIVFLLICSVSYAKEPSLAEVLEWKYGLVASTCQENPNDFAPNPKMVICKWRGEMAQPSEEQLLIDKQEYKDYLQAEKQARKVRKKALREKLGMTQNEIKSLVELVKDGDEN